MSTRCTQARSSNRRNKFRRGLVLLALSFACHTAQAAGVLNVDAYQHYIDRFNGMENESVANLIPNAGSWDWMRQNVPSFECPDPDVEEIYWYRWWTYRKHIKQLPDGIGITEFLTFKTPVSSAVGHHVMDGRVDQRLSQKQKPASQHQQLSVR